MRVDRKRDPKPDSSTLVLRSGGDKGTSKGNRGSSQRGGRNTEETVGS